MPATDPERLRDQAELMGNLVIDAVKASRPFEMNPKRSAEVNVLMTRMAAEMGLGDELIRPSIGIKPKLWSYSTMPMAMMHVPATSWRTATMTSKPSCWFLVTCAWVICMSQACVKGKG